jgi:hypothetical protein
MITDKEIDIALLANITGEWRKVARVVGMTMFQIDKVHREGRNDLYFAHRIERLVEKGLIEYQGDLRQMGQCEVRLPG